jgi:hypothetical protein
LEVTTKEAWNFVNEGEAAWVVMFDRVKPYCSTKQICMTNRKKATPRVATIEKAHMERAYLFGGDLEERERIKTYGLMNHDFFASITKFYDWDEFEAAKRKFFGREYSVVDGGDLIKPLPEKKDDQSQPVVAGRPEESGVDPKVPESVSGTVVRRPQSRTRKDDQLPRVRTAPSGRALAVPRPRRDPLRKGRRS